MARVVFLLEEKSMRAARALEELAPAFQKVSGARLMAEHLTESANRSRSFQVFIAGLRRVVESLEHS